MEGNRPEEVRDVWSRPKSRLDFSHEEKVTKDSFKKDSDINVIVARWLKSGVPPDSMRNGEARYLDFSNVEDYQVMQNRIAGVRSEFEMMPSSIRTFFQNDPANMIEWLSIEENREEAVEMGLLPPSPPAPEQPPAGPPPAPEEPPNPPPEPSPAE